MIVKIEFGKKECGDMGMAEQTPIYHVLLVECDSVHINKCREPGEDGLEYYCMVYYSKNELQGSNEIHLGRLSSDEVYIMEKGKTVDRMYFQFFPRNKDRYKSAGETAVNK